MDKKIKVTLNHKDNDFYFNQKELKHLIKILEYQIKNGKDISIDIK